MNIFNGKEFGTLLRVNFLLTFMADNLKSTKHCYINQYLTIKVSSWSTVIWAYFHPTTCSPSEGQNVFELPVHGDSRPAGNTAKAFHIPFSPM